MIPVNINSPDRIKAARESFTGGPGREFGGV
jgi:hypothetical protein